MSMKQYEGNLNAITDTPFGYTLTMIGGKWRLIILYWLVEYEVVRFNELHRLIGGITYKTLSVQLKEMEADGLIVRTEYPQIPPKVEYSLSGKGRSLYPIMESMCVWGENNQQRKCVFLTFAPATRQQVQALKAISQRVIRHNYTSFLGRELVDGFIGSGAADAEIDAGLAQCTVALDGDTVVGFVICKENLLHLIMVDTHFQRRGYGAQLLQAAEREIGQKHSEVELQSFSENTVAQCFYKKHGYLITRTMLDDGIGQEMTFFRKELAHENE